MTKRIKKPRRRISYMRRTTAFCRENGQLLFLLLLMFLGAIAATMLYPHLSDALKGVSDELAGNVPIPTTLKEGCTAVVSSSFFVFVLLSMLFLFGLTPYGWPLILCVPLFFGYMIGLAQCRVFLNEGLLSVVLTVSLPMGIASVAVLIGAAQSLQMSALFSRQLLPSSAHCGGLWQDFKLYLLRFLLCCVIAPIAATVKILLQYV